jgi:hypothetical protein
MGVPLPRCLWCGREIRGVATKAQGTYWRHTDGTPSCPDGVTVAEPAGGHPDDHDAGDRHGRAKCARSGCQAASCAAWRRGYEAGRLSRERAAA